ncbi:MAG: ATP-binding cassette domain-containing protein [Deltaproteobacteria bacterium]|nr:ATP-binding cassette domain-containing protein [Deltaproteobacteria bacterium]
MINAEGLTRFYGTQCAVDNISLHIKKGEIVGLLGPNGAGKTTTLRMLTGFLKPSAGKIRIKELNIDENPIKVKRLIGYLPESAPLYNEMLAYDYLRYIAAIRGIEKGQADSRLKHVAELCGINDAMHKPIGTLSKGYKQRVGLAHAMIDNPEILVLDEPTSGLDPNQIVEIRDIIREIGKEKTVILSTHILSEAEATCDRIIIINRGKIAADEGIDTLMGRVGKESFVNIALKDALFDNVRDVLAGIAGVTEVIQNGIDQDLLKVSICFDAKRDLREDIYKEIKKHDWILMEFYYEVQTLEKVFRDLTREN